MNTIAIVFYVLAVTVLGYAGFLFKKMDQNYPMYLVAGLILAACGFIGSTMKNSIQSHLEYFDSIQQSVGRLGATLPTSPKCIDTDSINGANNIKAAVKMVGDLQKSLQDSFSALKVSSAWIVASSTDKKALEDSFLLTDKSCSDFIKRAAIIQKQNADGINKDLQQWDSMYICDDICSFNGRDITIDKATYTIGGVCKCPEGTYPELDSSGFVKCTKTDTTSFNPINVQISNLNQAMVKTSSTMPKQLIGSFKFRCGSIDCPPSAPLPSDSTIPTTAAPVPTTAAPVATTAASTPVATTAAALKSGIYGLPVSPQSSGMNIFTVNNTTTNYSTLSPAQVLANIRTAAARTDNPLFFGVYSTPIISPTTGATIGTNWNVAYSYINPLSFYTKTISSTVTTPTRGTNVTPLLYTSSINNIYFYVPPY